MKIAVLITTRGNPEDLVSTCIGLARTAKHPADLQFRVRSDIDDTATMRVLEHLSQKVSLHISIGGRPTSLGHCINELAKAEPADAYCVLNDDVHCLSDYWDLSIEKAFEDYGENFVGAWGISDCPEAADYPIISSGWYKLAGKVYEERFPFWFSDRWLNDVHCFVTGENVKQLPIKLVARKWRTQRMRDLYFWFRYYEFLEPLRIAEAKAIADAAGKPWTATVEMQRILRNGHRKDSIELPVSYASFFDSRPPDAMYTLAKESAENAMKAAGFDFETPVDAES